MKITVNKNGSLRVEGEFTICDAEGNAFDLAGRTSISLCRCGQSGNKPFCDGTHKQIAIPIGSEGPRPSPSRPEASDAVGNCHASRAR